jgi:hypothetical protein
LAFEDGGIDFKADQQPMLVVDNVAWATQANRWEIHLRTRTALEFANKEEAAAKLSVNGWRQVELLAVTESKPVAEKVDRVAKTVSWVERKIRAAIDSGADDIDVAVRSYAVEKTYETKETLLDETASRIMAQIAATLLADDDDTDGVGSAIDTVARIVARLAERVVELQAKGEEPEEAESEPAEAIA